MSEHGLLCAHTRHRQGRSKRVQGRVCRMEARECEQKACIHVRETTRGWQSEGGDVSPFEPPPSGEHACSRCFRAIATAATRGTHLQPPASLCHQHILEESPMRGAAGSDPDRGSGRAAGLRGCGVASPKTTPDHTRPHQTDHPGPTYRFCGVVHARLIDESNNCDPHSP